MNTAEPDLVENPAAANTATPDAGPATPDTKVAPTVTSINVVILHAGMSAQSSTAHLANAFTQALRDQAQERDINVTITQIPLRGLSHSVIDQVLTGFPSPPLAQAQDSIAKSDGLIALTPTYQASYSGIFKAFFDVLSPDSLRAKPVILGATGGTARHSLVTEVAMRPLLTYMHADPVPTSVYAATEDWGAHASDSDASGGLALRPRILRATTELLDRIDTTKARPRQTSFAPEHTNSSPNSDNGIEITDTEPQARPPRAGANTAPPQSEASKWPGFADFETLLGGIQ